MFPGGGQGRFSAARDAMVIRPLDLADAADVHRMLSLPEVARRAGRTPWDPLPVTRAWLASPSGGEIHRLGAWEGDRLVAVAGLTPNRGNPREAHAGRLWVACAGRRPETGLLAQVLNLADRWLGLTRVELELPAEDPLSEALEAHGFKPEVRKRLHRAAVGGPGDTELLGRLRPGWRPAPGPPPRPAAPTRAPSRDPVVLRSPRPDDAAAYAEIFQQPSAYWGTLQLPTGGEALWRSRLEANDPATFRALVAEVGGKVVGNGGLVLHPPPHAHGAALGMTVHEDWQGRGIGRLLLSALLDLAEDWLGLTRVELEVFPDNERARRLYEGHHFEVEGVRRHAVLRDGAYVDVLVMARYARSDRL